MFNVPSGAQVETATSGLSGRTPPALQAVLTDWRVVWAQIPEARTGANRATVLRNLA